MATCKGCERPFYVEGDDGYCLDCTGEQECLRQAAVTPMFDEKKWAKGALLVQDACNLSGVLHSFSKMLGDMHDAGLDTTQKNKHPLSILFSSKVESLTGSSSMQVFSNAYEWAKKTSTENTDPTEDTRRALVKEINREPNNQTALEKEHGQVWNTDELTLDFDVVGFMAPYVVVIRKLDGVKGSMLFQGLPRFYWGFQEKET